MKCQRLVILVFSWQCLLLAGDLGDNVGSMRVACVSVDAKALRHVAMSQSRAVKNGLFAAVESNGVFTCLTSYRQMDTRDRTLCMFSCFGINTFEDLLKRLREALEANN